MWRLGCSSVTGLISSRTTQSQLRQPAAALLQTSPATPPSPYTTPHKHTKPQTACSYSLLIAAKMDRVKMKLAMKPTVPMAVNSPRIMMDM